MESRCRALLLLCLGLCLNTGTQAFAFEAPGPVMEVKPGNILWLGDPLTIYCYTPLKSDLFRLEIVGVQEPGEEVPALRPGHEVIFYLPSVRLEHAGRYICTYRFQGLWSRGSRPLDLVIAGIYSKPLFSISPLRVKEGSGATFNCSPSHDLLLYWVVFRGVPDLRKDAFEAPGRGLLQAHDNLSRSQSGMYSCFGFNRTNPYYWTERSNPMMLTVYSLAPKYPPGIHLASVVLTLPPLRSLWT